MNLLDKIGKGAAIGIGVLAGFMPQQVYADEGVMSHLAIEAAKKGRTDEARYFSAVALDEAKTRAEEEAQKAKQETKRQETKRQEAENRENQNINSTLLVEPIICNNYKKNKGFREGPTTTFSRKEDEISVAIIVQSKAPYFAEITIMDEEGKKLDSEKWNENPTELSKRAHWLLYNIAEWRNGTFFVNFIAKSSDGEFNVIRQIKIN